MALGRSYRPSGKKSRGFTLLEVLVALAVFATAAMAVINAANIQMSQIPVMRERTLANYVASNRLVEVKLENTFPEVGSKDGRMEMAGEQWYWRQKVIKAADDKLRLVRVSVSKDAGFDGILAEVDTYVVNTD